VNAITVMAGSPELDEVTEPLERLGPQCAADLQLLGKYEGSGFREDHFLAIRGDGQVVHLSPLLYWVLSELQPGRTPREVAAIVSARLDRQLTAEGVEFLVANKLIPSGLVLDPEPGRALAADSPNKAAKPAATRANPLLALRLHKVLLSEKATRRAANLLKVMFAPVVIAAALLSLVASDVALLATGAGSESLTVVLREPILMLAVLGLLLSGTLFHELGHAAGCRYGGGNPGVIGVGVYVIVPAFYTNVTDAYRLDRAGRLRTDLGGVYFNGIAAWAFGIGYLATGWTPLL
jgi:putative peptide zinc metalloprotease protein